MSISTDQHLYVEDKLLELLPHFENFFNRVGFKRLDGAIFGLLIFSKKELTSQEIEETLNLSQSAVSQSLKTLAQYSMINTRDHKELKRVKLYTAKEDALDIVASVIRKREIEYLQDLEKMGIQALGIVEDEKRKQRLTSILAITQFAKSISELIINLKDEVENPYPIIDRFPHYINMLKSGLPTITNAKDQITGKLKGKLSDWLAQGDMK